MIPLWLKFLKAGGYSPPTSIMTNKKHTFITKSFEFTTLIASAVLVFVIALFFSARLYGQVVRCSTLDNGDDVYNCLIIDAAQQYGYPDPRMFKMQVELESNYDPLAVSKDTPCGIPAGWTEAESKSFGLMQVTPACQETDRPDGSLFDPKKNIVAGMRVMKQNLAYMQRTFHGCTQQQYVLMASAGYVSGNNTVAGCDRYKTDHSRWYVNTLITLYNRSVRLNGWPEIY